MKNTRHFISDLETLICIQRLFREYCMLVVGLVYILPFDHDMQVDHTYHRWWCAFSGESPLSAGGFSWSYPLRRECELTPEWRGHFWRWRADLRSRGATRFVFVCKNAIASMGLVYTSYIYLAYIYHEIQPNVGQYTIHGWYGNGFYNLRSVTIEAPKDWTLLELQPWSCSKPVGIGTTNGERYLW